MTPEEQLKYFDESYRIIAKHVLLNIEDKVYIGSATDRKCRYCKQQRPDVSFKLKAHAVPEFIGNKSLIANDECDECNERFSRVVEDHFGKYLGALRTIAQIQGKKGVPTYKGRDGKSRVSMEETGLHMTGYEEDPIYELDLENKKITITAHRQPYSPMGVFKCLVKMAIAIAPEEELDDLDHLIQWIRKEEHTFESFPYSPLIALQQFTPGPMPYRGVSLFLLKRKTDSIDVPLMQFAVAFGNTMYQIVLPMPKQDQHLLNKPISLVFFPIPFKEDFQYGRTTRKELDFSSSEIVRDEPHVMNMRFKEASKVDVT
ncbi:MAG: HNH endonuclease [Chromatiales bacterium]|nr:HNH endonuclease [Chromatiales bacterium]